MTKKRNKPNLSQMTRRLDNDFRQYIYARDDYQCQVCGIHKDSTNFLDASHKVARSNYLLRWNEKNVIALCRSCHDDWGRGITDPQNSAIDRLWGEGTALKLEHFAKQYPISKGTFVQLVSFRQQLQVHYKEKLKLLNSGISKSEIMAACWQDFGVNNGKSI